MIRFEIGSSVAMDLFVVARKHGASEAELAAIQRLLDGRGEMVDVERLEPLALLTDLPWRELFPELGAPTA